MISADDEYLGHHLPQHRGAPLPFRGNQMEVMLRVERLLAYWAWNRASRLRTSCPGLAALMHREPLRDAVPAEEVGAAGQLGLKPDDVCLADLAHELGGALPIVSRQLLHKDLHLRGEAFLQRIAA